MKRRSTTVVAGCFLLFLSLLAVSLLQPPATKAYQISPSSVGAVSGVVSESADKQYLPGARVVVQGTRFGAVADRRGRFRIQNVPTGAQRIIVSAIGYKSDTLDVSIEADKTTAQNSELRTSVVAMGEVVITGMLAGQARAFNQQKNADNIRNVVSADLIGRFPDPNVADALQRVPGVSIDRDQGEGRFVQIRGTSPLLNSVMVNGERLPSPEASGDRSVALDVIPSDVLASIEVSKAVTPDMDGDAIGGAVNLITRSALDYDRTKINATLAGGYSNLSGRGIYQGAATIGTRLTDNIGILVNGSYNRADRGSENNEMTYIFAPWIRPSTTIPGRNDTSSSIRLNDLQLRNYLLTRQRRSVNATIDFRFDDRSSLSIRGMYNNYSDDELRRTYRVRFDPPFRGIVGDSLVGSRIEPALRIRQAIQQINSLSLGGKQGIGSADLDYNFSYSYAQEERPNLINGVFRQSGLNFRQDVSDFDYPQFTQLNQSATSSLLRDSSYLFQQLTNSNQLTTDRDLTGGLSIKIPFLLDNTANGVIQAGVKIRNKNNSNKLNSRVFSTWTGGSSARPTLANARGSFTDDNFLFSRYDNRLQNLVPDPDALRGLFDSGRLVLSAADSSNSRITSDAATYNGTENVIAGFALGKFNLDNLMILGGLRYEYTNINYTAGRISTTTAGRWASTEQTTAGTNYGNLLPALHINYKPTDNTNIRAAWTNTLARPRYVDISPVQRIDIASNTAQFGNPDLKAATSMNFDLMGEQYFSNIGIISAGAFVKNIQNFAFNSFFTGQGGITNGFVITQPQNGQTASLFGVELSVQQQLSFLPGFLDGFGIFANYTFTTSNAIIPTGFADGRTSTRTIPLPGQSANVGNAALSYEKYGFMARVALNYGGRFLDEVGATEDFDRYQDNSLRLDVSANYRFTSHLQVFVECINLTNQPLRAYIGIPSRPAQREFYSWWGNIGIRIDL
jgi:TonB-dependent receptor